MIRFFVFYRINPLPGSLQLGLTSEDSSPRLSPVLSVVDEFDPLSQRPSSRENVDKKLAEGDDEDGDDDGFVKVQGKRAFRGGSGGGSFRGDGGGSFRGDGGGSFRGDGGSFRGDGRGATGDSRSRGGRGGVGEGFKGRERGAFRGTFLVAETQICKGALSVRRPVDP